MSAITSKNSIDLRSELSQIYKPKYDPIPVSRWFSQLVTNGTFDSDLTGWSDTNTFWTYSSGTAYHASSSVFNPLGQQLNMIPGKTYNVSFVYTRTSGDFKVFTDNESTFTSSRLIATLSSSDNYSTSFVYDGDYDWVGFSRGSITSEFTIDNFSVREAYELPSDILISKVFDNGALLTPETDYTVSDDGFKKTINFTVEPNVLNDVLVEYYQEAK